MSPVATAATDHCESLLAEFCCRAPNLRNLKPWCYRVRRMEALGALLRPALTAELDLNANRLDAELEVKKLQQLVWKLEWQNEQLRNSSGGSGGPSTNLRVAKPSWCQPSSAPSLLSESGSGSLDAPEEQQDYFLAQCGEHIDEPSLLDELELLDLNSPSFSDESDETWLYVSSRGPLLEQQLSPLQWCRLGLDAPTTRRSISQEVKQASRWHSPLSCSSPPSSPLVGMSTPVKPFSTPKSDGYGPPLSSPLHPLLCRTLSPLGREFDRSPSFLSHRSHALRRSTFSPTSSAGGDAGGLEEEDEEEERESIRLGYKPQDLTDVQVIARLQEESLRQDFASVSSWLLQSRGRRHRSRSFSRGLEVEDRDPCSSPRPPTLAHSRTFSSGRDWSRESLASPPPTPGLGLGPGMGLCPGPGLGTFSMADPQFFRPVSGASSDKLRRSLPSLLPSPSLPCVPASSRFRRCNLSFDSSTTMTSFHSSASPPGRLQQGRTLAPKATTYIDPIIPSTASGALQAISGSGRSSIPVRSRIDTARSTTTSPTPRSRAPQWRQI